MVRSRFALILYFCMVDHKAACHTLLKDMVLILLIEEVPFTQDSKVEDLFCSTSSGSEPSLFISNYLLSLQLGVLCLFKITFNMTLLG